MRTERKRRRKILIAIIMITHSRSAKTLCCNNNYVMLNTDSVRIFQGGEEKKTCYQRVLWFLRRPVFLDKCQNATGTES